MPDFGLNDEFRGKYPRAAEFLENTFGEGAMGLSYLWRDGGLRSFAHPEWGTFVGEKYRIYSSDCGNVGRFRECTQQGNVPLATFDFEGPRDLGVVVVPEKSVLSVHYDFVNDRKSASMSTPRGGLRTMAEVLDISLP